VEDVLELARLPSGCAAHIDRSLVVILSTNPACNQYINRPGRRSNPAPSRVSPSSTKANVDDTASGG
jgi:hypothetical protein